jgi:hypothetical protein
MVNRWIVIVISIVETVVVVSFSGVGGVIVVTVR